MNTGTQPARPPMPVPDGAGGRSARMSLSAQGTRTAERAIVTVALTAIVCLPLIEILGRPLVGGGILGSIEFVRHLTLWIGFMGAVVAVPGGRHLAFGLAASLRGRWQSVAVIASGSVTVGVCLLLAKASLDMVLADRAALAVVGGIFPLWVAEIIMPVGFALIGMRFLVQLPGGTRRQAVVGALALLCFAFLPPELRPLVLAPRGSV